MGISHAESEADNHAMEVWAKLVEPYGRGVANFEHYLIGKLRKGEISVDLRLYKKDSGYVVYVNDFTLGRTNRDKSQNEQEFIVLMGEFIKKLRLEGVDVTWMNIQGSYASGERLREEILKQL